MNYKECDEVSQSFGGKLAFLYSLSHQNKLQLINDEFQEHRNKIFGTFDEIDLLRTELTYNGFG